MKIVQMLVVAAAIACPAAVAADLPLDAAALGRMRGILDACRRTSPGAASAYLLQMKALIGQATKQMVGDATRTDEYQQAYGSVRSELGALAPDEMADACRSRFSSAN